jgi:hypothetical protein
VPQGVQHHRGAPSRTAYVHPLTQNRSLTRAKRARPELPVGSGSGRHASFHHGNAVPPYRQQWVSARLRSETSEEPHPKIRARIRASAAPRFPRRKPKPPRIFQEIAGFDRRQLRG